MSDQYKCVVIDGTHYYGKHLIFSATECNENLLSKEKIALFLINLVERIEMTAFGEPIVKRFGQGIEVGISGVQLIETSAITLHTNDMARDLYLDIFSCKNFKESEAINFVSQVFTPNTIDYQVLLRK